MLVHCCNNDLFLSISHVDLLAPIKDLLSGLYGLYNAGSVKLSLIISLEVTAVKSQYYFVKTTNFKHTALHACE